MDQKFMTDHKYSFYPGYKDPEQILVGPYQIVDYNFY